MDRSSSRLGRPVMAPGGTSAAEYDDHFGRRRPILNAGALAREVTKDTDVWVWARTGWAVAVVAVVLALLVGGSVMAHGGAGGGWLPTERVPDHPREYILGSMYEDGRGGCDSRQEAARWFPFGSRPGTRPCPEELRSGPVRINP